MAVKSSSVGWPTIGWNDAAAVAKSVVTSSGVIVDGHEVALPLVCDDAPTLNRWVGGRKAWTAPDAVDRSNDAVLDSELPVRWCFTRCYLEAHKVGWQCGAVGGPAGRVIGEI